MLSQDISNNPTKEERLKALASYDALAATIESLKSDNPEIEIEETKEKISVPLVALKLFARVLQQLSQGNPVSIVPVAAEVTTQAAAEYLGCSRPHLIKLLDKENIPYTRVGRHRRILMEDLKKYKDKTKANQKKLIQEVIQADEASGLYDL